MPERVASPERAPFAPAVSSTVVAPSGMRAEADLSSGRKFGKIMPEASRKIAKMPNFLKMPFFRLKFLEIFAVCIFGCFIDLKTIRLTAARRQIEKPITTEPAERESEAVKRPVSEEVGVVVAVGVVVPIEVGFAPEPESSKVIFVSGDVDIVFPFYVCF